MLKVLLVFIGRSIMEYCNEDHTGEIRIKLWVKENNSEI